MKEVLDSISEFVQGCLAFFSGDNWSAYIRDFCIQLIATIILFLFVRFFLWKPITNLLEAKRSAVDKELDEAKAIKQEALEMTNELEEQMAKARNEVKELLEKAEKDGLERRESIIEEAKIEANKRIDAAKAQIETEIKRQKDDIKNEIVDIAFLAAEKIVGKEVSKEKYLSLVEDIIDSGK